MRYLWAFLVFLVIVLSLTPGPALQRLALFAPNNDKFVHFSAYAALAFLPVAGFRTTNRKIQALVFVFFLGYLLELAQSQVPGRSYDLHDLAANAAGILTGTLVGLILRLLFQRSQA